MWPDRVSNPGPLTYESGALPTVLPGQASGIFRYLNWLFVGNPGSAPSPASQSTDEQAYLEKLKHLSKYVEPLRRMIKKTEKQDGR